MRCRPVRGHLDVSPAKGTVYGIMSPLTIATHDGRKLTSRRFAFNPSDGHTLTIELDGLDLRLAAPNGVPFFTLCSVT